VSLRKWYHPLKPAMRRPLLRFRLCFVLVSYALPMMSQTPALPPTGPQAELDAKLMATLTWDHCDIAKVRALLQQGANSNAANWDGDSLTALMVATQNGCVDIVELLLKKGAKVNATAGIVSGAEAHVLTGITALSLAPRSGNLSIVKMLVERGADIHAQDSAGRTALAFATTNEIAQFFLDHGLDINARDKDGYTLLIRSGIPFHRPSIAFLLEHGADPNAKATDGTTALKLAQGRFGHPDDVELLKKAGAKE
jgi:ankyrin repeat protein